MKADELGKSLCPPALLPLARRLVGRGLRFEVITGSWADALAASDGYDDPSILERVRAATQAVIAGQAAYERDSVLFHEPKVPFHIAATLLRSAALDGGRLDVVDVGGSLGSTYRQCRSFLARLEKISWNVVEQPRFVTAGRADFETDELLFNNSIDELAPSATPYTLLLSSVLQYLEEPYVMLERLATLPARHLMIDRSPVSTLDTDRLYIQRAPRSVYSAKYPCWIFSRKKLASALAPYWRLVADYSALEGWHRGSDGLDFEFRGMVFERREAGIQVENRA